MVKSFYIYAVYILITIIYQELLFGQRYQEDIFSSQIIDSDIVYGNAINDLGQSENLLLNFHEPENDSAEKRPLVLWIHGGSFTSGSRTDFNIEVFTDYLVPKGYTTAHVSYRLSSQNVLVGNNAEVDTLALFKAVHNGVHDLRAAVRFFKLYASNYRIDPDRIYVAGISAGAIIGIELGYIDKISELYPDVDPVSLEGNSGNNGPSSDVAGVISLCGTSVFPSIIEGPNDPPLFMAHDTRDPIVPYENARATFDQAVNVGTFAHGNFYDSGLHCSWSIPLVGFFNLVDVQNQLKTFLFNGVSTSRDIEFPRTFISVFPNPFGDKVHVQGHGSAFSAYSITNILGKEVAKGRLDGGTINTIAQLKNLTPGVYILALFDSSDRGISRPFTQKIVKTD